MVVVGTAGGGCEHGRWWLWARPMVVVGTADGGGNKKNRPLRSGFSVGVNRPPDMGTEWLY